MKKIRNRYDDKETFQAKFIEVHLDEVNGDTNKLIKRFLKKVRKEEILKPYYGRLMYHQTRGQKTRKKKLKGVFLEKKRQEELKE